jgi:hypothetical protein
MVVVPVVTPRRYEDEVRRTVSSRWPLTSVARKSGYLYIQGRRHRILCTVRFRAYR